MHTLTPESNTSVPPTPCSFGTFLQARVDRANSKALTTPELGGQYLFGIGELRLAATEHAAGCPICKLLAEAVNELAPRSHGVRQ